MTLAIDPPDARAQIALSSFPPDERLEAQTIHLAPGTYVAIVDAPDYESARREIVVAPGRPQTVTIHLEPRFHPSRVPPVLVIGGAALLAGALAYDLFALQPARDALGSSNAAYDAKLDDFHTRRTITIGMFAGGAALALVGIALRVTVFRHREVEVSATVGDGGAQLAIEWRR